MSLLTHYQIKEETISTSKPESYESTTMECARLIHAAIISRSFREKLLANPIQSLEAGYCGEKFYFTREEKSRIKSIRAASLDDFANQLLRVIETEVVPQLAYVQ